MRVSLFTLDAFVVMPNHFQATVMMQEHRAEQGVGPIVGAFTSLATNHSIVGARQDG